MTVTIHPTALVDSNATLGQGVAIGPYCVVGPHVVLKDGVTLKSHVCIEGHTTVGENTIIYPFASLGTYPQSTGYKGEATTLEIGKNNQIREHVTMNIGTIQGHGRTVVGDNCFIMVGSHIGHDCIVGNNVIMANNATLGGHVTVGDRVNIGGLAAIHQRVRIGAYAMISGTAGVKHDVVPYGMVMTPGSEVEGLNIIGMKRNHMSREDIHRLRGAFKMLARDRDVVFAERLANIEKTYGQSPCVRDMLAFIQAESVCALSLPIMPYTREQQDAEEALAVG